MAVSVFRYYYFLEDGMEKIDQLVGHLRRSFFKLDEDAMSFNLFNSEDGQQISHIRYENMLLMVLGVRRSQGSWSAILESLDTVESEAGLPDSDILGRVTILGSDEGSWEELLESARVVCVYREAIHLDIGQGQLARLGWQWPRGHAYYLFREDGSHPALDSFFGSSLPLIEAALIRLGMVSKLYRDRVDTISKERQECDTRLSHILHTQLVSERVPLKEVEELEDQIRDLSFSYGILSGDYSLISEGSHRLIGLVDDAIRQVKGQYFLSLNQDQMKSVLQPYRGCLARLKEAEADLSTSRGNHQAAIDVVRSRIDIMMSRENIKTQERIRDLLETNTSIQKQSLTFQIAAGIIEFIVLAYYSHSLWEAISPAASVLVPPWIQLVGSILLSATVVVFTHLLAEYRQGEKHVKGRLIFFSVVLFVFLAMIIVTSSII